MKKLSMVAVICTLLTACTPAADQTTPDLTATPSLSGATSNPPILATQNLVSLEDLSKHMTKEDCWTAVRWDVYDISGAFGKHPGGDEAILGLCGKDGTEAFTKQHGGQEKPERMLSSMPKVGKLK